MKPLLTKRKHGSKEKGKAAFLCLLLIITGCRHDYIPKPRAYFRIDLPRHSYMVYDSVCPYMFEYPVYTRITPSTDRFAEPCWINIVYAHYKATVHISYKSIKGNLEQLFEDSRTLVYKHTIKAESISEQLYTNTDGNVYGILYDITGNAASNIQFVLTDSVHHFIRGALYFRAEANADSLAPVIRFIREDIIHLMETLDWKSYGRQAGAISSPGK